MSFADRMKSKMSKMCEHGEHGEHVCGMCHGGKMAQGGYAEDDSARQNAASQMRDEEKSQPSKSDSSSPMSSMMGPMAMAEGGDIVDRLMAKRYSKGGQVANSDEPVADFMPNEFDDLHLRDELEEHYTGANSGDELSDDQEDADRKDFRCAVQLLS